MTPAPTGEKGMVEASVRPQSRTTKKNRLWWIFGALSGIMLCGLALAGTSHRRGSVKLSTSPVDEKTPLLVGQANDAKVEKGEKLEKSVTIVEPTPSPSPKSIPLPGDEDMTPKKKSTRRRVRGRKKRRDSNATLLKEEGEGEDDDDEDKGDSSSSPPLTLLKKDDKPLPELPREMTSTALGDMEDKERLAISDTIIGKSQIRRLDSRSGFGSHGTVVLKGTWGGRPVAVKRLLSDFTRLASQEVKLLQASDDHPNVIRCGLNQTYSRA